MQQLLLIFTFVIRLFIISTCFIKIVPSFMCALYNKNKCKNQALVTKKN